jgi:deazaflavin-dependent oxidoreductase (nitroreductase family)
MGSLGAMPIQDDTLFGPEHVRVYQETDGERGYIWKNGTHILLLTTTGRKSGEPRVTPLIHRTDGDRWIVVASKGGWDHNPIWFKNLEANPQAEIQVLAEKFPVTYRVAEGEERERLWKKMVEVWPDYETYQSNTDREIPVVILERA